jgi:O-antigen/teichoic acid export membrane protein
MIQTLKTLLLENKGPRQTILKNLFWLTSGQFATRLIRAGFIIYAARLMGAAQYGVFSYALGVAAFLSIFADIGINTILTREVARGGSHEARYFSTAWWIKAALTAAAALLVIVAWPMFSPVGNATLMMIVALLIISDGVRDFLAAFFRGRERMELDALIAVATNAAIAAGGVAVLLYVSRGAYALTLTYAAGAAFGALVALALLRKRIAQLLRAFDWRLVRPLIAASWPVAILGTFGAFMLSTDTIMIGWLRSETEIGYYAASQRIVHLLYVVPLILSSALFPRLSRIVGGNEKKTSNRFIENGLSCAFLLAIPIAVGGAVLGDPIVKFVYGAQYAPAILSFKILVSSVIFVFPGMLLTDVALAHNRQKTLSTLGICAATANIILNALLIPLYGIAGSALGTLIVACFYHAASWRLIRRMHNVQLGRRVIKMAGAGLAMGAYAYILNLAGGNILLNVLSSGMFYMLLLHLLKEQTLSTALEVIGAGRKAAGATARV